MRLVVIIVAALTILGVAALGLILAQKGGTPTATAASTVRIASVTQEVSALPTRAPVSQIAQATGSEASPLILLANVDAQSGSPMTTVTQAPSAAAAAPNVKDQSPSTISKAMVHETTRLKDDATGWAHKLQELELDLKLQLISRKPRRRGHGQRHRRVSRRAASGGRSVGARCGNQGHIAQTRGCRSRPCDPRGGASGPGDSQDRRLFSTKDHRTARSQPLR